MRKPPTDRGRTATGRGEARVRRALDDYTMVASGCPDWCPVNFVLRDRARADAALAGKVFLWSLGALGEAGPGHLIGLFIDELRASLGQLGCATIGDLRDVPVRHPGAWRAEAFAARA